MIVSIDCEIRTRSGILSPTSSQGFSSLRYIRKVNHHMGPLGNMFFMLGNMRLVVLSDLLPLISTLVSQTNVRARLQSWFHVI